MKKEDIHLEDWKRIIMGSAPGEFMLEIAIRTLIIYLILLIVMRLLGKRMGAQLTITEMAVMLTLGAIVAVPMQVPERGLLPAVVLLLTVLALQRGVNWLALKNRRSEVVLQGDVSLLVKDGVLQNHEMKKTGLSHEQVFARLRSNNIQHLGSLKRVYLEAGGFFSIYKFPKARPGLSVLPLKDKKLHDAEHRADGLSACLNCATVLKLPTPDASCPNCGHKEWSYAVQED
ncbi:DUF421 domain-containing protein [Hymenobacter cavernae]|uniref:YetF C-terminal domain-containing protein n=1 Tax=Hymenobacter cavernae TaxID=2044852 RepID=A0ABQ1USI3_9BACT|nr:YetF domain-containing protein [Hymenobacter cavernae]GGF24899.1 hypothetical protein GCM10011383_40580 [Hymenobacter cavernae]